MNRKSFFRLAWVLTLLLTFSMGCQLVTRAQEWGAVVTEMEGLATEIDIEGLSTQIDLEGLTTDIDIRGLSTEVNIEGLVTEINIDELATEMAPVLTDMGALLTDMPGLDSTLIAVATPAGFPEDIPVMDGPKLNMSGTPTRLEYTLDTDFNAGVDYYRREMLARGWTETSSNVQDGDASLIFQKGARRATVVICENFLFGLTFEITVEG